MTIEQNADLVKEWLELHRCHESYERYALIIKLLAVTLTVLLIIFAQPYLVILLVLAVLWLQEGVWKTYQARTSDRIELIELTIMQLKQEGVSFTNKSNSIAFQFYSQWSKNRAGATTLVMEYLRNSIKPTVIYPYVPLMVIALIA